MCLGLFRVFFLQENGNVCLAILDGSGTQLGDLNIIGGEKQSKMKKD